MKKTSFAFLLTAALSAGALFPAAVIPVQAETEDFEYLPLVYDEADLLNEQEETELLDKLENITDKYGVEVAVATVNTTDGVEMNKFTDDFYDDNYYGLGEDYDGILFMVSIQDRNWHITTHGYARTVFTQDGLEYLRDKILPDLKDDDFTESFNIYADTCELFLAQAETGEPYDSSNLPKEPFSLVWIPISLGVGFLLALICILIMRSQLKSVRNQESAVDYVRDGSMQVTRSNDIFLYHTVTRTEKAKDNDSSSSGSSDSDHGGIGGSF